MSKRDFIHDAVREGLEKDGWMITHDPLKLPSSGINFKVDLGAEKVIIAEKGMTKIAVEIKSLTKQSLIYDFYEAFGQYMFYRDAFNDEAINREIFMAVSKSGWERIQKTPFILKRIEQYHLKLIVIDITNKKLIQWIE